MGSSGSARPFTDADREHLRQLHAKGWTRNDIARTLQRSPATVSRTARSAPAPAAPVSTDPFRQMSLDIAQRSVETALRMFEEGDDAAHVAWELRMALAYLRSPE